ncbi:MAG: HEAT repeat domain-containing protein [Deltaproteobacteria bacterium]|nr:HEAT repeat domain-containing protein [Deltaproteobacteria bacterium]
MSYLPKILTIIGLLMLIQGCAPSSYVIKNPTPSNIHFQESNNKSSESIAIIDARSDNEKLFSYGVLKAGLILEGKEFDPIAYLKAQTQRELEARGLSAVIKNTGNIQVEINKFYMRNHRTNGYTPFITLTMLSAELKSATSEERIVVYIKRGKVPVWSFNEIVQPTLNEPLDLLVKEFAAKLNMIIYGSKISDNEVKSLVAKIESQPAAYETYLYVYQLGFGNNKTAIPALVKLTNSESEYVRLAAISSLGILKATDQSKSLQDIAQNSDSWQDRSMAFKAIGDIGNPEAIAFLKSTLNKLNTKTAKEDQWAKEVVELYLQ